MCNCYDADTHEERRAILYRIYKSWLRNWTTHLCARRFPTGGSLPGGGCIGAAGALVFLVALDRSVLPPLLHSWGWVAERPCPIASIAALPLLWHSVRLGSSGFWYCSKQE